MDDEVKYTKNRKNMEERQNLRKEKQIIKDYDAKCLQERRADVMELFMELDQNNDGYVDRKDLLKNYHMLDQIIGATSMIERNKLKTKCKMGH